MFPRPKVAVKVAVKPAARAAAPAAAKPAAKPAAKAAPAAKTPERKAPMIQPKVLTKAQQAAKDADTEAKAELLRWAPPEGFKQTNMVVNFGILKDGTIDPSTFQVETIKGAWNSDGARFNMAVWDQCSVMGLYGRLNALLCFHQTQHEKRMPPNREWELFITLRTNKDGWLEVAFRQLSVKIKGEFVVIEADAAAKAAKKPSQMTFLTLKKRRKLLNAAFMNCIPAPTSQRAYDALQSQLFRESGEDSGE